MRTTLTLLALSAVLAACGDDQQQPTSPVTARTVASSSSGAAQVVTTVDATKKVDQVGFTKVEYVFQTFTAPAGGGSNQGFAMCPVGSFVSGGGFTIDGSPDPTPTVRYSRLFVGGPQYGWSVVAMNKSAVDVQVSVMAVCVS